MGELIDVVLSNPFLLLLVIGGLISLFRRKEGENTNERPERDEQTAQRSEQKKPSPFEDFLGKIEGVLTDDDQPDAVQPTPKETPARQTASASDQRLEQMQQLSEQIQSGERRDISRDIQSHTGRKRTIELSEDLLNASERRLRKDVKQRLTKKSLIDSIIMAEVLGEPRSRKPYENRNMNRHKLY